MNDQTPTPNASAARKPRRWGLWLLLAFAAGVALLVFAPLLFMRVGFMPLVFNESFYDHSHCIKIIGLTFNTYANDNAGKFPTHTNGYGDALLLMMTDVGSPKMLTGPCYSEAVLEKANREKSDVPEAECGRVYVQGLAESANPEIFLLFDKQPTHGGDHYHGWGKLSAALGREVWTVGSGHKFVRDTEWLEAARKQIELLVAAGIPRERAVALYTEKPKYTPGLTAEQLAAKP